MWTFLQRFAKHLFLILALIAILIAIVIHVKMLDVYGAKMVTVKPREITKVASLFLQDNALNFVAFSQVATIAMLFQAATGVMM